MFELTEVIGAIAALLTTVSFLPQVYKSWQSQSADDFSWVWVVCFSSGIFLWLVYGLSLGSPSLIGANGVTLMLVLVIGLIKWRSERRANHR